MKPIRYRLSLLVGLTTLVAVGCCWVRWPEQTAVRFVDEHYLKTSQVQNPFRPGTPEYSEFEFGYRAALVEEKRRNLSALELHAHERSIMDLLVGRQSFDFGTDEFTVCRGQVVAGPTPFFESSVRFYR